MREILSWVSLWQLKEYRLDRMFVHLRDTQQGHSVVFSFEIFSFAIGIILYGAIFSHEQLLLLYSYIIIALFLYEFVLTLRRIQTHTLKRPVMTVKSVGIATLSLLTLLVSLIFPFADYAVWILCLGFSLPFIVAFYVFLFAFPTEIYTDLYLQKAEKKRESLKKLTVIAVSGSYGKSSTKEIIAHILGQKYKVVKTLLSQNTPLAIAQILLKRVTGETDFFVAELGAYKKGEIDQLAKMVKPTIGITTAVSDQHLALYGGMKEVVESEMELIHAIPKKGFVLFNGNSKGVKFLAEQTTKKMFWYKTSQSSQKNKDTIIAYDIEPSVKGVAFKAAISHYNLSLFSPLLGVHTVENILPAVFLGLHFNLSEKEIIDGVASLKPLTKTMEQKNILPGVTIIDDTFNASPESVSAAVDYLKLFPRRKILIMSPLIELGSTAKKRHGEIGEILANIDIVLLTNKNFLSEIKAGIARKKGKTIVICDSYSKLAVFLKETLKEDDAVVFEGKEAGIVLSQL